MMMINLAFVLVLKDNVVDEIKLQVISTLIITMILQSLGQDISCLGTRKDQNVAGA